MLTSNVRGRCGGMTIEVEPSHQYSVTFCCCRTNGSRGAVWSSIVSDMEVHAKHRCVIELLHAEKRKATPTDIHQHLLNIYGDQTVDASTVRQWVHFSAMVTVGHLYWYRFLIRLHAGSCSWLVKLHSKWWWLRWKTVFCTGEFALSESVIVISCVCRSFCKNK